jgi:hypothetical protein
MAMNFIVGILAGIGILTVTYFACRAGQWCYDITVDRRADKTTIEIMQREIDYLQAELRRMGR